MSRLTYNQTFDRILKNYSKYDAATAKMHTTNPSTPDAVIYVQIGRHNVQFSIGKTNENIGKVPISLTVHDDELNINTRLSCCVFSMTELQAKVKKIEKS